MRQLLMLATLAVLTQNATCQQRDLDKTTGAVIAALNALFGQMSERADNHLVYSKLFFTERDRRYLSELGYEPINEDTTMLTRNELAYISSNVSRVIDLTDDASKMRMYPIMRFTPLAQKRNTSEYAICFASSSYEEQYYAILLMRKVGGKLKYIKSVKESLSFF